MALVLKRLTFVAIREESTWERIFGKVSVKTFFPLFYKEVTACKVVCEFRSEDFSL